MAIPKKGTAPAGRKSMKMEADELTEKIKACVKEALDEQAEAKAEGEAQLFKPFPFHLDFRDGSVRGFAVTAGVSYF